MGKIKDYKYIVFTLILVIASIFYWYEWRPSHAAKICGEYAKQRGNEEWSKNPFDSVGEAQKFYELSFELCMHERGF